ncbi:restriction endonuclease subunit S, partial [Escherichia coli]|nr:restriction endonuclease subunit S [Escherichia coli]
SKVKSKNRDNSVSTVLTNSATLGIVCQESYFEREIVTESNLTGYYVVEIGDFVYNPRISSTAPVGPIKLNELSQGVMSPLYTVFRFNKGLLK